MREVRRILEGGRLGGGGRRGCRLAYGGLCLKGGLFDSFGVILCYYFCYTFLHMNKNKNYHSYPHFSPTSPGKTIQ